MRLLNPHTKEALVWLSLLDKQACHHLAASGPSLLLGLGPLLSLFLAWPRSWSSCQKSLLHYADLAISLLQVFDLNFVRPNNLKAITSVALYKVLSPAPEPPLPKILLRLPSFPWNRIWPHTAAEGGLFILPTECRHRAIIKHLLA